MHCFWRYLTIGMTNCRLNSTEFNLHQVPLSLDIFCLSSYLQKGKKSWRYDIPLKHLTMQEGMHYDVMMNGAILPQLPFSEDW